MPAASFLPVIGLYLGVPMLAFAILRLGWFFTRRVDGISGAKTFLFMMGAPAALALLVGIDWHDFTTWLRVPLVLVLLAFTFISVVIFFAVGFAREKTIRAASSAHPTWLTGISIGIVGITAAVAIRVGLPVFDTAPLLTAHADMIHLRSMNLLSIAAFLLVVLFYLEDLRIVMQAPEGHGSTGWRNVGLIVVAFGLSRLIALEPLPGRKIEWFLDNRADITAIPLYRIEDLQEALIGLWQRDAIAILIISMIAALMLLPIVLNLCSTAGRRRFATTLVALGWLAFAAVFALIYPAGEFDLALSPNHGFILGGGLAMGAMVGGIVLDRLRLWCDGRNPPYLVGKFTPVQLLLLALVALYLGAFFVLPNITDTALALALGLSLRFGVIALVTIWSIRYCARIYEGNSVAEPVATATTPALEIQNS